MAAGYFAHRMTASATFSLFIRGYPANRNFYVAAGLQDVLLELERSRFTEDDIDYLKQLDLFSHDFLTYLRAFHFTGSVTALPEGTLFFADEPILEVTAPLIEAQIFPTQERVFELNHTRVSEQQCRIIRRYQGARRHDLMAPFLKEIEIGSSELSGVHCSGLPGACLKEKAA